MKEFKILLAKPGLDGHDVGVKVLAHGLRDAGFAVVYTGLRKSIEEIVDRARAEQVHAVGLSILSGNHHPLCARMAELLAAGKMTIPWFVGGNIPAGDVAGLEALGASRAFPTGTTVTEVVDFFNAWPAGNPDRGVAS